MSKYYFFILCLVICSYVVGNEDLGTENSDQEKDNVVSEKESKEEPIQDEANNIPKEEFVKVSNLKVVQDNVSGNKHSAFSEDKTANRADEQTVSDIKKEAENRVLEKENNQMKEDLLNKEKENIETSDSLENKESEDVSLDWSDTTDDIYTLSKNLKEIYKNIEGMDPSSSEDPETEIVDLDKINLLLKDNSIKDTDTHGTSEDLKVDTHIVDDIESKQTEEFEEIPSPPSNTKMDDETEEKIAILQGDFQGDIIEKETTYKSSEIPDSFDPKNPDSLSTSPVKDVNTKKNVKENLEGNKEADQLYKDALQLLQGENKDIKKANKLLLAAAELNHTQAMEEIAYPLLFGDNIKRNESISSEFFHHLANKGSPVGQQGLGFMYGTGVNANSSQAKALIYTTFAALGGHTLAEMMLGYRYHSGTGVTKSCESALTYYKKVAKKVSDLASSIGGGNAVQRVRLYDELELPGGTSGQIDEDLLQYYQFLADKGDTQAQIGLGQLYFQGGRGVDINYQKAFQYFKLASETGNGNGLSYIGKMYLHGLHVDKDAEKAFKYFTESLESKNPIGQAGLGMIYLKGEGVEKDYDKALQYFSQAAEQGWVEGQLQLGNMYYNGVGVKKDFRQAVKYFTFASQSGHVLAFYNLALMHATGAGVMRSCRTATELFKNVAERGKWSMSFMDAHDAYKAGDLKTALIKYYQLAELGYEVAQSNVAYMLDKDEATFYSQNQTHARALLQWSRAADQGYSVARVKLGDYYYYGLGTKVNYETAALQYRLASDQQSNAQAMFNLGYMHEQGFGLKKDIYLAKRFYDMAAEASPDAQFPVYLALVKLAIDFSAEWIQKNYRFWELIDTEKIQLYVMQNVGPEWDIYLITLLAGLLCSLLIFQRCLRPQ